MTANDWRRIGELVAMAQAHLGHLDFSEALKLVFYDEAKK